MTSQTTKPKSLRRPITFGIMLAACFGLLISAKLLLIAPMPRQSVATPPVARSTVVGPSAQSPSIDADRATQTPASPTASPDELAVPLQPLSDQPTSPHR